MWKVKPKSNSSMIPGYQKLLVGTLAALEIGLAAMRAECLYFYAWL